MMGWMAPLRHLSAKVLVGSSSSTRVSLLRASPITCSISISTTFANTPRNSVGWPVFGTLNRLTPARLQA